MGLRRQAASHLQHPRGPAEVSKLLSVSDARVWSVDMEEMSFMEEEGGRLSLLFTAAPVLRESTAAGDYNVKDEDTCRNTTRGDILQALNKAEHPDVDNINNNTCETKQSQCVYDETGGVSEVWVQRISQERSSSAAVFRIKHLSVNPDIVRIVMAYFK